jgi:uncharacterized protein YyaL (SSP411 family)
MISALAKGAAAFGRTDYADAAGKAARFILSSFPSGDGGFYRRFRKGEAGVRAYLDDYAFFVSGLIDLYRATFDPRHLVEAVRMTEWTVENFWDESGGGFYFTSDGGEELLVRRKDSYDSALPSGNSVFLLNLLRLYQITAGDDFKTKAVTILKSFSENISQHPTAHTVMLQTLDFLSGSSQEIVVVGDLDQSDVKKLIRGIGRMYLPNSIVLHKPTPDRGGAIVELAPYVRDYTRIDGKATVYVCEDRVCRLPTTDIDRVLGSLS